MAGPQGHFPRVFKLEAGLFRHPPTSRPSQFEATSARMTKGSIGMNQGIQSGAGYRPDERHGNLASELALRFFDRSSTSLNQSRCRRFRTATKEE